MTWNSTQRNAWKKETGERIVSAVLGAKVSDVMTSIGHRIPETVIPYRDMYLLADEIRVSFSRFPQGDEPGIVAVSVFGRPCDKEGTPDRRFTRTMHVVDVDVRSEGMLALKLLTYDK